MFKLEFATGKYKMIIHTVCMFKLITGYRFSSLKATGSLSVLPVVFTKSRADH